MNGEPTLVRTDGSPITERQARRGLRVNILAGMFGNMWGAGVGTPLVLVLQVLGASGVLIGLATTVQQLAMTVQIPGAFLGERFSSRKKFWAWMVLPHRLLWFVPAVLPFVLPHNWPLAARLLVWMVAISSVLAQSATASWYSWMADLVPQEMAGLFWGRRQSAVMASYLVAVLFSGIVLDAVPDPRAPGGSFLGFSIVFAISAVFGTSDILIHLFVPEPRPHPVAHRLSAWQRVLAPLRVPDFRWLSLSLGVWTFAIGLITGFGIVYLKREYQVSYLQLSSLTLASSIGAVLLGFPCGYAIDQLGARTFGVVLFLVGPLTGLSWFFLAKTDLVFTLPLLGVFHIPQSIALLSASCLLAGGFYSGIGLCQIRLLSALTTSEGRTMAMAVHWTIIGITAALGPLLAGTIMDWFYSHRIDWVLPTGMPFGFFHVLVLLQMLLAWLVAAPLLLKVRLRKGDLPVGAALPRLWLGNPVQAVRNLYNIYAISAAVSTRERAKAVRDLGVARTALAVSDLIDNLDDPAFDVREEAVTALGKIGNAEAVQALLAKLADPDSDLAPQIVRALRPLKDPRRIEALIGKLFDADRETQAESARALGESNDPRAVDPLLELLHRSADGKVFAAGAEALARLRAPAAVALILPRLQTTPNRVLKKTLRLTLGDLLGSPGEFYKVLAKEHGTHGREVERLLDELRSRNGALIDASRALEKAYETGQLQESITALQHLANVRFRCPPPDPRPAGVLEYLARLQSPWASPAPDGREEADLLLGIYLFCQVA